jgi:hypothetical protein
MLDATLNERDRELHTLRLDLKDINRTKDKEIHMLQHSNGDLVAELEVSPITEVALWTRVSGMSARSWFPLR